MLQYKLPPVTPSDSHWLTTSDECPESTLCTEKEIVHLLQKIGITAQTKFLVELMLRPLHAALLTKLFNLSINTNYIQFNNSKRKYTVVSWKWPGLTPTSLTTHLEHVECFKYLPGFTSYHQTFPGLPMLSLYAAGRGNCCDYCTQNTINMLSHRSYSSYTYPWYVHT